ncbi:MAG: DUF4365 domain-containing protein [Thermosynechococcaceae cyanobacterium]
MSLPAQYIEERLSWAHIQAIASQAGLSVYCPDQDFGIDGTFREVTVLNSRYFPSGYALDFQLKASIRCKVQSDYVVYDLEVKTYNDLVNRSSEPYAVPCILLVKALPEESAEWVVASDRSLLLNGACYWSFVTGPPSFNKSTVRIRIPRAQVLTPQSVLMLLDRVRMGTWNHP